LAQGRKKSVLFPVGKFDFLILHKNGGGVEVIFEDLLASTSIERFRTENIY